MVKGSGFEELQEGEIISELCSRVSRAVVRGTKVVHVVQQRVL